MTNKQKQILEALFRGGHIVKVHPGLYTVRDAKCNPIRRANDATVHQVFKYCKKIGKKTVAHVLDKKLVLKLRANHWVKKRYKEVRDQLLILNTADAALAMMQSFPVTVGFACEPCVVESATPVQIDRQDLYDHLGKLLHLNNTN